MKKSFSDAIIEVELKSLESRLMQLQLLGVQDGQRNLNITEEYWNARVYMFAKTEVQKFVDLLQQRLQPLSAGVTRTSILSDAEKTKQMLDAEHRVLEQTLANSRREVALYTVNKHKNRHRLLVSIFAVSAGFADATLAYEAFYGGGMEQLQSIGYSIAIAGVLSIGALRVSKWALKAPVGFKRLLRLAIPFGVAFVLFIILGEERAAFYNSSAASNSDEGAHVCGLALGIVSFIFFLASTFFLMEVNKTEAEEQEENQHKTKMQELVKTETAIASNRRQQSLLVANTTSQAAHLAEVFEYAVGARKRAISVGQSSIGMYTNSYLTHQTSGQCPSFLSNPPDLSAQISNFFQQ